MKMRIPDKAIGTLAEFAGDAEFAVDPELLVHDLEESVSLMGHVANETSDGAAETS